MYCTECKTEYDENITVCPKCNVPLIDKPDYINFEDWVLAFTTDAEYEADMLKANLEGAGIEAFIFKQKDSSFPAVGNLAVIKLFVPSEKLNAAKEIINDINKQKSSEEND